MKDKVTNKKVVHDAKWLKLVQADATIRGRSTQWLYCTRKQDGGVTPDRADVVVIVPFVKDSDEIRILLVKEFRIPLGRQQIGFPAGLIDPGENAVTATARELREETGYQLVRILEESPTLATSAGLTDETYQYVFVEAEHAGEAKLEHSESIEVLSLKIDELATLMSEPNNFCGRVWSLCYHYVQTKQFPL